MFRDSVAAVWRPCGRLRVAGARDGPWIFVSVVSGATPNTRTLCHFTFGDCDLIVLTRGPCWCFCTLCAKSLLVAAISSLAAAAVATWPAHSLTPRGQEIVYPVVARGSTGERLSIGGVPGMVDDRCLAHSFAVVLEQFVLEWHLHHGEKGE